MAKQAKASYSAHIPVKWMILKVCLKERTAECIRSDPFYPTKTASEYQDFHIMGPYRTSIQLLCLDL